MTIHTARPALRSPLRRLIGAGALVLGLSVLAPLPASAEQNYWVPADETWSLQGHGYGHGRGMSQYGARGAASKGLTWRQILAFYYPGTAFGTAGGRIKVLLTEDVSDNVQVSAMTGLRLRDLADGRTWALEPPTSSTDRWDLRVNGANRASLAYHDANGWHPWRVPGRGALHGDGEFYASRPLTLWITNTHRDQYRGSLRMVKVGGSDSRRRDTVNVVGLEAYVQGVVPREMPVSWDPDAVAAQAVAARTYAVRHRQAQPHRYFHVDDTISYQVYGGVDGEDSRSNAAARNTRGTIVTYDGRPALTEFSSSSGGWTAGSDLPYQVYKRDPYDVVSGNPNHNWSTSADVARLERTFPGIGELERIRITQMPGGGDWGGRVGTAYLVGTSGSQRVTGDDLRRIFGLKSNWFRPVDTPIIRRWRQIGGWSSVVGAPRAGEYFVSGGTGQAFQDGWMYHSSSTGAHAVHGPVLQEYSRLRGASGVLRLPTSDVVAASEGNAVRSSFERGVIYAHPTLGSHGLYGPVYDAYADQGWTTGPLGLPTTDIVATSDRDARRIEFQGGVIYYRSDLGAHALHGPTYESYASQGWTTGPLGLPTSDTVRTTTLNAWRTSFQGGVIYYRSDVGAHLVTGPIYTAYARQGWTTGRLGLPTTDVHVVAGGLRSDFQGGWIFWDESSDRTTVHYTS